jgi:endoglucanase
MIEMTWHSLKIAALCLPAWFALAMPCFATSEAQLTLPGVNLPSGSFGSPGNKREFDYTYPKPADIDYFADKGFKSFRISFLAKRLLSDDGTGRMQPTDDMNVLGALIDHAAARGGTVVLDMHDYGLTRSDKLIGRDPGATKEFAAQWRAIAREFADRLNVVFGLMNEPNKQTAAEWLEGANAAVAAIRQAGAKQLVLVPGSHWGSALTWTSTDNAQVMSGFRDPGNNSAFEVHQYLDAGNSGGSPDAETGAGSSRLVAFTEWARKHGVRAYLGEFGWAANEPSQQEGRALLCYMSDNQDVWLGWSYWAGGPWWGDYMYSIQPKDGMDRPQMKVLSAFLNGSKAQC